MGRWGDGEMGRWGDGEMGKWRRREWSTLMSTLSFERGEREVTWLVETVAKSKMIVDGRQVTGWSKQWPKVKWVSVGEVLD